ncbi:nucleotide sugar dehydrogenase [Paenibacillus polysaccharolyticus]|uniref:nucleotide sugar dehydrogenase n=1 Tax=Paenibacillus polysaccharolyticus TaxID=582692 RepID=UPI00203C95CE|nr:nucleotide sugar dehydrogenase [Paenibacillus polysaccharolyticus]MCM3135807.1 nucleotide sugar dehydrogenase [Paenibacillus polysaccharolyticus]
MNIYDAILTGKEKISIIGLGYVGLQLAVEFGKKTSVIGLDKNENKILSYKKGIDPANEVCSNELIISNIHFTSNDDDLKKAKFHIVAVPTPVNSDKTPDLTCIKDASKTVAQSLTKGSYVVYESTVYPGVTEEICIPILEEYSGLTCGIDFKVGYSPERITPGDKRHSLINTMKVVSGIDKEALHIISQIYGIIFRPDKIFETTSIKVAEAAKVTENTQRDVNIALMNELSIIFNTMGIDSKSVIQAAATKWNFVEYNPGIVGGHCIGVDPYYLTYKAEQLGYIPELILASRKTNENMGKYIAENTIKKLIQADKKIKESKIMIVGFTYKEDVSDMRNTKVIDIIKYLNDFGAKVYVTDPLADINDAFHEFGIKLYDYNELEDMDAIIYAVPHKVYKSISLECLNKKFRNEKNENGVLIDIKGNYERKKAEELGLHYWSL